MLWKEVTWNPPASLPMELGWTSNFTQRERSAPDVSVWEVVLDLYRGWSQRRQLLRHEHQDPLENILAT